MPDEAYKVPRQSGWDTLELSGRNLLHRREERRYQSELSRHEIVGRYKYACLSSCRGHHIQENMTTSKKFPRPIKRKRMPKAIADAIRLCYALEFRYLWVGSICIIQNDSQDRQKEASRMQRTYERSSLTKATPICETSSQSFIDQRRLRSGIMKQKARLYPTDSGDFCWLFEPPRDCCSRNVGPGIRLENVEYSSQF